MPLSGRGGVRDARPKTKYTAAAVRSSGGLAGRSHHMNVIEYQYQAAVASDHVEGRRQVAPLAVER